MAKVEVDEQEYRAMEQGLALLRKLGTDPKSKSLFERAAKAVNPDIVTEEDVAERYAAPVRDEMKALAGRFDTFLSQQEEAQRAAADRQATQDLNASIERLRADGYTDEGLGKIKQLMVDRKIADPEAAAALFDRQNPPAVVADSAFEPASWNIREDAVGPDTKRLFEDESAWADREAAKVLNELARS